MNFDKELEKIGSDRSKEIKKWFEPMVSMLERLQADYENVLKLEQSKETSGKARELRLQIKDVRIQADKVRKKEKEKYLIAGKAIQGVYNVLLYAVNQKEKRLKEIEEFYERQERLRIQGIADKRIAALRKFSDDELPSGLGEMEDSVWENYYEGKKTKYLKRIEEEKAAELKEQEEKMKQAIYNRRLIDSSIQYGNHFNPKLLTIETSDEEFKALCAESNLKLEQAKKEEESLRILTKRAELRAEEEREKAEIARREAEALDAERKISLARNFKLNEELRIKNEKIIKAEKEIKESKSKTSFDEIFSHKKKTTIKDIVDFILESLENMEKEDKEFLMSIVRQIQKYLRRDLF